MLLLGPSRLFKMLIVTILMVLGLVVEKLLVCLSLPDTRDETVKHTTITILCDGHVFEKLRLRVGPPNMIGWHWDAGGAVNVISAWHEVPIQAIGGMHIILADGVR